MPEGCPLLIPTGRWPWRRRHSRGKEASGLDTQTVMIDKERWFPSHTPSSIRERPNPRGIRAWGVGTRQYAPSLESHWDRDDPWEGHVPEGDLHAWHVRKARYSQGEWLGAWAHELAPKQSSPRELHFDKATLRTEKALRLGTMLLRSTLKIRKYQADTWTKTPIWYIRFYDKQTKVRFHIFRTSELSEIEFNYNSVTHFSEHWAGGVLRREVLRCFLP